MGGRTSDLNSDALVAINALGNADTVGAKHGRDNGVADSHATNNSDKKVSSDSLFNEEDMAVVKLSGTWRQYGLFFATVFPHVTYVMKGAHYTPDDTKIMLTGHSGHGEKQVLDVEG